MRPRSPVTLLLPLLLACSEPPELTPGTFRAGLNGALTASLSGSALGEDIFTEEFPQPLFAIRMLAENGDTGRMVSIRCAGAGPLPPGNYPITPAVTPCAGGYLRFVSSLEEGTTVLESMQASSGSLTIVAGPAGQSIGRFSLRGPLVVGVESAGDLSVSGTFDADVLP